VQETLTAVTEGAVGGGVFLVVTPPQPVKNSDPTIDRGSDRGIDRLSKVLHLMALVLPRSRDVLS
jgi:hypothetical protein